VNVTGLKICQAPPGIVPSTAQDGAGEGVAIVEDETTTEELAAAILEDATETEGLGELIGATQPRAEK
jgi:hypothetical protein